MTSNPAPTDDTYNHQICTLHLCGMRMQVPRRLAILANYNVTADGHAYDPHPNNINERRVVRALSELKVWPQYVDGIDWNTATIATEDGGEPTRIPLVPWDLGRQVIARAVELAELEAEAQRREKARRDALQVERDVLVLRSQVVDREIELVSRRKSD